MIGLLYTNLCLDGSCVGINKDSGEGNMYVNVREVIHEEKSDRHA
jgi:hypothetical protein